MKFPYGTQQQTDVATWFVIFRSKNLKELNSSAMDVQLLSHFIGTLICTLFTPIWVPHTQDGRKWHVEFTFHHFKRWIFLGIKPCKLLRPMPINKFIGQFKLVQAFGRWRLNALQNQHHKRNGYKLIEGHNITSLNNGLDLSHQNQLKRV